VIVIGGRVEDPAVLEDAAAAVGAAARSLPGLVPAADPSVWAGPAAEMHAEAQRAAGGRLDGVADRLAGEAAALGRRADAVRRVETLAETFAADRFAGGGP